MQPMRLNRFLARAGAASSRRKAESIIAAGRVFVNGQKITDLSTKVDPNLDKVTLDENLIILPTDNVVLMLYKPAGYITSHADPHAKHTVFDLIDEQKYPAISYIGRLDKDTTGLLLFTNDGALAQALTHPKYHVDKTYFACVQGVPTEKELENLRSGVLLEDGMTAPAQVELLENAPEVFASAAVGKGAKVKEQGEQAEQAEKKGRLPLEKSPVKKGRSSRSFLKITIHEGKKRQIKRMCLTVGHRVLALHRQSFGSLDLGDLEVGESRELSLSEVEQLKACATSKMIANADYVPSAALTQESVASIEEDVAPAKESTASTRGNVAPTNADADKNLTE